MTDVNGRGLDLISTSQKSAPERCIYGAPLAAWIDSEGTARITQTCCNHWNCPRCFATMAANVRRRMVFGAETLSAGGNDLYFWTLTCRGRDLDLETADDNYYEWTNRALSRLRYHARKQQNLWAYVQVTERQQRGAAHSHLIQTYAPKDGFEYLTNAGYIGVYSDIFQNAINDSGLGNICEITRVDVPAAVAVYISGYLTKHGQTDVFPKHWKRVRWSREWPDMPEPEFIYSRSLLKQHDYDSADKQKTWFAAESEMVYALARKHMLHVSYI